MGLSNSAVLKIQQLIFHDEDSIFRISTELLAALKMHAKPSASLLGTP